MLERFGLESWRVSEKALCSSADSDDRGYVDNLIDRSQAGLMRPHLLVLRSAQRSQVHRCAVFQEKHFQERMLDGLRVLVDEPVT